MPSFCVIPSCVDKYSHRSDISFHKFPHKNSRLLEKWIEFVVQERGTDWKPSRWSSICSRHFNQVNIRDHSGRRNLKTHAIPTLLNPRDDKEEMPLQPQQLNHNSTAKTPSSNVCRMCGNTDGNPPGQKPPENDVSTWISKCFPTISFDPEISPCPECISRLKSFAEYVDVVTKYQSGRVQSNQERMLQEKQVKPVKIKQEVIVKEEIHPTVDVREDSFEENPLQMVEKTSCDQYLDEMFNYDQSNEVENCEIMEISDLEKVFIDIAEETSDTEVKIPPKNRIEIISSISVKTELKPESWIPDLAIALPSDHTYSKSPFSFENRPYKVEKLEGGNTTEIKGSSNTPRINIIGNLLIPHRCDKCPEHFETLPALTEHKRDKHIEKIHKCFTCGALFDQIRTFLAHKIKHQKQEFRPSKTKRVKCKNCGMTFASKLSHNHHQRFLCEVQKGLTYSCPKCSEEFPKLLHLRYHTLKVHGRQIKLRKILKRHPDGRYPCDLCGRSYGRASNLRRHQQQHRPRDQWDKKCEDCCLLFETTKDLIFHLKSSFACQTFRQSLKTNPPEDHLQFMCSACGRQFSTQNGLKLHEAHHQIRETKPCVCETCGKHFQRSSLLWQHRISHTDSRNFRCKLCPKVCSESFTTIFESFKEEL
ncbi:hypothetical protein DMENIID0001_075890 [Sergentomyia squamirostris]